MELHSYAKRGTSKKWTIEQKRKLVEARILHDASFTNKPSSVAPWKNILAAADLDDFNVFFVRKQWSNMLARYKQYKQTRLGNIASKTIDAELIKRINEEWEFFEAIHTFMTRKTTNLHSYALTHRTENSNSELQEFTGEELVQTSNIKEQQLQEQQKPNRPSITTINLQKECAKENIPNNSTIVLQANNISNADGIHLFNSDTTDFEVINEAENDADDDEDMNCVRNTDHDFYSKSSYLADTVVGDVKRREKDELHEQQQSNYFADASDESQSSLNMIVDLVQPKNKTVTMAPLNMTTVYNGNGQTCEIKTENITQCESLDVKQEIQDPELFNEMPSTSTQGNLTQNMANLSTSAASSSKPRLSERDRYYRHKRRFNRRMEKRFDGILHVMCKIVNAEYPTIDVTPLKDAVTAVASTAHKMLSSDSEDDD